MNNKKGPAPASQPAFRRSRTKKDSQITQEVLIKKQEYGERCKANFRRLDQFGQQINLTWKGEQKFKTTQGATVSLMLLIVMVVYASYGLAWVFNRTNPQISKTTLMLSDDLFEADFQPQNLGFDISFGLRTGSDI